MGRCIRVQLDGLRCWVRVRAILSYVQGVTVLVEHWPGYTEVVTLRRRVQALGWDGKTIV